MPEVYKMSIRCIITGTTVLFPSLVNLCILISQLLDNCNIKCRRKCRFRICRSFRCFSKKVNLCIASLGMFCAVIFESDPFALTKKKLQ